MLLAAVLSACAGSQSPRDPGTSGSTSAAAAASAGVSDPQLAALLVRHWEDTMRRDPLFATRLGDHRFDDRINDNSAAGMEDDRRARREFLAEAQKLAAAGTLQEGDAITVQLFIQDLQDAIAADVCVYEEWTVDPRDSPLGWNDLAELHPVKTVEDGRNLVARFRLVPQSIDNHLEHLERGAKKGLYGNVESTKRVVAMFKTQLAQKIEEWPMTAPAKKLPAGWSEQEKSELANSLRAAVSEGVKPALERYLAFLESNILPHARGDDKPGLTALPFAGACYKAMVASYTTTDAAPEAIHAVGRAEIARINGEMQKLGKKLFGTDDLAKIFEKLRTDPALRFSTAEEVEKKAQSALAAAKAKIGDYFGILPRADCVVTRIPDYEAPYTTIAYYRPPVPDGTVPGQYFINIYQPETRPRFEAEALAFHEAIPGHHLQIAISQELPALPAFRKHGGMTVFVEGWALYTEQLAEEMGLYSGDLDRMGMLSFESWRAARLVVDTGLHAMGWSRDAAKKYMMDHTPLAANNVDNEVDRYINWPGQAVAYKTGQMEIRRLRRKAEAALGDKFDIKTFHDVVLKNGAVTLPILGAQVDAWIKDVQSKR